MISQDEILVDIRNKLPNVIILGKKNLEYQKQIEKLIQENKKLKNENSALKKRNSFLENILSFNDEERSRMENRITELKNENKKLTKNFKNYENKAQLPNNDSDISPNSDELENDNISEVDSLEMDEINKLLDEITPNEPNKRKANTVPEIISLIENADISDIKQLVWQVFSEPYKPADKEKKMYNELLNTLCAIIETKPANEPKLQNYIRFFALFSKYLSPTVYQEYKERICKTRNDIAQLFDPD